MCKYTFKKKAFGLVSFCLLILGQVKSQGSWTFFLFIVLSKCHVILQMTMMHRQQGKSQQRQTNQPKHSKREQLPDTLQKWRKPGGKEREREKEGERERDLLLSLYFVFIL